MTHATTRQQCLRCDSVNLRHRTTKTKQYLCQHCHLEFSETEAELVAERNRRDALLSAERDEVRRERDRAISAAAALDAEVTAARALAVRGVVTAACEEVCRRIPDVDDPEEPHEMVRWIANVSTEVTPFDEVPLSWFVFCVGVAAGFGYGHYAHPRTAWTSHWPSGLVAGFGLAFVYRSVLLYSTYREKAAFQQGARRELGDYQRALARAQTERATIESKASVEAPEFLGLPRSPPETIDEDLLARCLAALERHQVSKPLDIYGTEVKALGAKRDEVLERRRHAQELERLLTTAPARTDPAALLAEARGAVVRALAAPSPVHALLFDGSDLDEQALRAALSEADRARLHVLHGKEITHKGALGGALTKAQEGDVVVVTSLEKMPLVIAEAFAAAVETVALDIMTGEGAFASAIQIPLHRFTLVGIARAPGLLPRRVRACLGAA